MATIKGFISDTTTSDRVAAKVHVLTSNGHFVHPPDAVLKVGPGHPFFYCDGEFEVKVPVGGVRVLVERGTEYVPLQRDFTVTKLDTVELDLRLERWTNLPQLGWFPGNTHIHYDQNEKQRDKRLKLEGHVHDFSVTVVSVLRRWDLDYASNHYPIGVMNEFSTAHHVVDIGEENRHNKHDGSFGYGHVMFLRIRNIVEPVSRGMLVDNLDPDYPPLCFACDDAREQGGIVLWCHNGQGMEAPVAAALGKLDGFNLFDPFWMDPEYEIWYRLLNCGIALPASTGSDWFVCSNNRVYVQTANQCHPESFAHRHSERSEESHSAQDKLREGSPPGEILRSAQNDNFGFSYDNWIDGMKAGRTFITNGPALFLRVNGREPSATLDVRPDESVEVEVALNGHHSVDRVQVILNGEVVRAWEFPEGIAQGTFRDRIVVPSDGWLAARVYSHERDSFLQEIYAHTSPVYFRAGVINPARAADAHWFIERIDDALEMWIGHRFRYANDRQRSEVRELFRRAREVYVGLK